ncbi:hypothetical protein SAMN06296386_101242 [Lachnospiraceae bacterium]|nr:hypothetical protein SAMN06296386_101242 [Lachnospiraceae bacterium]
MKRIIAILGILILVGLYAAAFVLAILDSPNSGRMFMAAIVCTVMIPVMIHLFLMMNNARKGKDVLDETYSYREKKDKGE